MLWDIYLLHTQWWWDSLNSLHSPHEHDRGNIGMRPFCQESSTKSQLLTIYKSFNGTACWKLRFASRISRVTFQRDSIGPELGMAIRNPLPCHRNHYTCLKRIFDIKEAPSKRWKLLWSSLDSLRSWLVTYTRYYHDMHSFFMRSSKFPIHQLSLSAVEGFAQPNQRWQIIHRWQRY